MWSKGHDPVTRAIPPPTHNALRLSTRERRERPSGAEDERSGKGEPRCLALRPVCDAQDGCPQGAIRPRRSAARGRAGPSSGAGRDVGGPAAALGPRRRPAGSLGGRPAFGRALEPGGVGSREDRGVPDVLHEPAVPAERRAQQHRHAGPQAGGHQAPAARHRPVSARGRAGGRAVAPGELPCWREERGRPRRTRGFLGPCCEETVGRPGKPIGLNRCG